MARKPIDTTERIAIANSALQTFAHSIELYRGTHELRIRWDIRQEKCADDYPARLRGDGTWPKYGYYRYPTGGTGQQAIAQLIRYIRDLNRLPIDTWKYWASDTVKLCNSQTVEILQNSDYGNPKKTRCVLCGSTEFKPGLDWWSLNGLTGPCCWGGKCKHTKEP